MIRSALILAGLLGGPFAAGPAAAETCLLTYEDTAVFQGPCHFRAGPGGSFAIYDARGWRRGADGVYRIVEPRWAFAATLDVQTSGLGIAYANLDHARDDPSLLHPSARFHASLGRLRRHGACWLGETSALCAWE